MDNKNKFLKDEFLNKSLKVLGIILLFLAVLFMASMFKDFFATIWDAVKKVMVPFLLAWLISLLVYPLIKVFERRGVGIRWLSVLIVYLIIATVLYFSFAFIAPRIGDQIRDFFATDYPVLVNYFQTDFRTEFIFGPDVYDQLAATIEESGVIESTVSGFLDNLTTSLGGSLFSILTILLILPILLVYYLLDYEEINDSIRNLIPQKYEKDASDLGNRMNKTVGAYLRGQLSLMLATGLAATALYKLVGLEYFVVFGLIVGLTNIIPYFGAIIALVPVLAYAIITDDVNPFVILGVNVGLQFLEGNFFQPIIMGRQLEMHPLIIIASILFFGSLFGTLGVVFAAPLAATIRVLIHFYQEKKEQYKQTP
jgi:putative permease